jgi:outer membrane receptor for ferrienterochelin and colicins
MRAWLVFLLAANVALASVAGAQEPLEAPEIVVEGEREKSEPEREQVFEDTPVETEVIPERVIREMPITNGADLARHLTGFRTQSRVQGEEAVVSIEGLPPEYTRILVNGQRYSGSVGGVDDLRDVPVHALERVEVKRGTQGVRQGGEGAGGTVEFVTRRPPDKGVEGSVDGGWGTDGKILVSTFSGGRVGPVGLTLSAVHDQIDGFDPRGDAISAVTGGSDSQRLSRDLYGTALWSPIERLDLHSRLGWRHEDENFVLLDADGVENHADPERRDFTRWITTNGFDWKPDEATRVRGDLTWYSALTDSEVGRTFEQDEDEWRFELNGERLFETGPLGHALTIGLDLRRPSLDLRGGAVPPGLPPEIGVQDADEHFRTGALFVEDEIALLEQVSLLAGLRGEVHDEFGFDVLPQVAVLVRPLETVRMRFSWGMNRRTPTLEDLYQPAVPQLGGAYFLAGNPDLETESSTSWRAGVEWNPRDWIALSVVGFWNEIDDAIRSTRFTDLNIVSGFEEVELQPCPPRCGTVVRPILTPATLYRKQNLAHLRTRGIEAELRVRPHPRIETRFGYTFLDTKIDDESLDLDELPNSPRNVVDGTLVARLPWSETQLALTGRWRGPAIVEASGTGLASFADSQTESDPSLILDLRVTQPVREGVALYMDFQNMTNEAAVDSYAIRGFTFFVGVRAELGWAGKATP